MKCPGQDTQYWKPGAIFDAKCPKCGQSVEFFKDDTFRKCPGCGYRFINPQMDFGCASYCQFAEQCVGNLPPELLAQKEDLLKNRVAIEMKRYFKTDFKRIGYAMRIARYAERIGKAEGGNLAVILCAAYLHDIGKIEAGGTYATAADDHHQAEGGSIARSILEKLGAAKEITDEVCDITTHHHHPRPDDTLNFKVLFDAALIADLEDKQKTNLTDADQLKDIIDTSFLTEAGRKEAVNVLFK